MKIATFLTALLALITLSQSAVAGDLFVVGDFAAAQGKAKASGKLVMIDFAAEWCGPCKLVAPVLEKLEGEREDIRFAKVDVDNNQELAVKYDVRSIPTLLLFNNGEVMGTLVGAANEKAISGMIDSLHK